MKTLLIVTILNTMMGTVETTSHPFANSRDCYKSQKILDISSTSKVTLISSCIADKGRK